MSNKYLWNSLVIIFKLYLVNILLYTGYLANIFVIFEIAILSRMDSNGEMLRVR